MRILSKGQSLDIDWSSWKRPEIFNSIQDLGDVPESDMRQSMNLGIGLILIVSKSSVDACVKHLEAINEQYSIIGRIN